MNTARLACVTVWMIFSAINATAQQHVDQYLTKPDFKVMAEAENGKWGASWGYCSLDDAIEAAKSNCTRSLTELRDGVCRVSWLGPTQVTAYPKEYFASIIDYYRNTVEQSWLEASRNGTFLIEILIYGGEAEDWDEFVPGHYRSNPTATCLTEILGSGPSADCTGTARFAGYLNHDGKYPAFGEVRLHCSNGQELTGESVSLTPGVGFVCAKTLSGGWVMGIFGPGSHGHGTSRDTFLRAYDALVIKSGLDKELCGWGLLVS